MIPNWSWRNAPPIIWLPNCTRQDDQLKNRTHWSQSQSKGKCQATWPLDFRKGHQTKNLTRWLFKVSHNLVHDFLTMHDSKSRAVFLSILWLSILLSSCLAVSLALHFSPQKYTQTFPLPQRCTKIILSFASPITINTFLFLVMQIRGTFPQWKNNTDYQRALSSLCHLGQYQCYHFQSFQFS